MTNNELIALWHFDEDDGPVAWNAVKSGAPMEVRQATRQPGRFGTALCFRKGGENAVAPGIGSLRAGTVSLWIRLDEATPGGTFISIHDQLRIGTDKQDGTRLIATMGECAIEGAALQVGRWTHVAATFGGGGLSLYVDGAKAAHREECTSSITSHSKGDISYVTLCPFPSNCVACAMDEVAIFRVALNRDAIAQLARKAIDIPSPRKDQPQPMDIRFADYVDRSDPTCGLQGTLDAAATTGGRVTIPPGRFVLRRPVMMPSRVTLAGSGGQSVLATAPGFVSLLVSDAMENEMTVTVQEGSGFSAGDPILVDSQKNSGYNATHARIVSVEGNQLHLDRPLWGSYEANDHAIVARWYPMIQAMYQHDFEISDLAIEGMAGIEPRVRVNFTCSAIDVERSLACRVSRVEIRRWLHDGICFGKSSWHRVADCMVRDGYGHGYHPGNRSRYCTFTNNMAINNGVDGFFFCCRVEDNIISGNLFQGNGRHGIGGLGDCWDTRNLVTGNQCIENGKAGICLNGGSYNTVTNNICRGNSRAQPGEWSGIHLIADTSRAVVRGNHCFDDAEKRTQRACKVNDSTGEANVIEENVLV